MANAIQSTNDYLEKNFFRACSNASSGSAAGDSRVFTSFGRSATELVVDEKLAVSIPEAIRTWKDTWGSVRFNSFAMVKGFFTDEDASMHKSWTADAKIKSTSSIRGFHHLGFLSERSLRSILYSLA